MHDLRFAARQLIRSPGFTATSVLTLGLGIGACIAMFSVVDGVLLRPPPLPDAGRLVLMSETFQGGSQEFMAPSAKFLQWQGRATSFQAIAATAGGGRTFEAGGQSRRLKGLAITFETLGTLGIRPLLGRDFQPQDRYAVSGGGVALLGYGFWRRQFGGRPEVVGQSIQLGGKPVRVVGVLPPRAEIPDGNGLIDGQEVEVFSPLGFGEGSRQNYAGHWLKVFGRLKPGVTLAQAQQEMDAITARTALEQPTSRGWAVRLVPLMEAVVRPVRPALLSLLAAVGFLLLIACANVANLLLARAVSRSKEMAVRAALGAGRGRLVRLLLVESLLLWGVSAALGLAIASGALSTLLSLAPSTLPRAGNVAIDGRAVAFTLLLTLVTGLVFGLVPALHVGRGRLQEALKQASRGGSEGAQRLRLRGLLVAGQVATAVVLLTGAGLLMRSFVGLLNVSPGFDPDGVLAVRVNLEDGVEGRERPAAFADRAIEQLQALPGVTGAAVTSPVPFMETDQALPFGVVGRPTLSESERPFATPFSVTPGYFRTMRIPLLRGRLFDGRDGDGAARVAIISDSIARRFFPGQDPIGRSIDFFGLREIVGVVGDVKTGQLQGNFSDQIYQPFAQVPMMRTQLVVRTEGQALALAAPVRAVMARLDRRIPLYNMNTVAALVADSIARQRFAMTLFAVFSGVAVLLAVVGIYGVMAYTVSQRAPEIGIRMALGAQAGSVLRLVCARASRLIAAGMAAGLVGAVLLTGFLETLLFDLSSHDPLTFAGTLLLIALAAAAACLVPARKATQVNPMSVLRSD
jgi:putative ABC transport system permease protein